MNCPQCGNDQIQKNGCRQGRQRYRCKHCRRQFADTYLPRGYSNDARQICIHMYQSGLSLREIERFTGVSHGSINNWVKQRVTPPLAESVSAEG
ncbi:MAG: hypothetical protein ACFCVD_22250 [Nodosilinea sp.]